MTTSWGEAIFWTATIIAGLLLTWVVWTYAYSSIRGEPIVPIVPIFLAILVWFAGWTCKILAEH
jgi:hypothetical protein